MLDRFANIMRIADLRRKLLFTAMALLVCRAGVYIPVPGVNVAKLQALFEAAGGQRGIMDVVNLFAGGALSNCAIFGLGVMPYISASIIFQLLASVVPALERLRKE